MFSSWLSLIRLVIVDGKRDGVMTNQAPVFQLYGVFERVLGPIISTKWVDSTHFVNIVFTPAVKAFYAARIGDIISL